MTNIIKKIFPLIILFLSITAYAAASSEESFIKKFKDGIAPKSTEDGRQQWYELMNHFKKSSNPELVLIALKAKTNGQRSGVENSIGIYDLFVQNPSSFIKAASKFDKSFNCVLTMLIPRTQYIPFANIDTKLKSLPESKLEKTFSTRARKYYSFIKEKKLVDEKYRCKMKTKKESLKK